MSLMCLIWHGISVPFTSLSLQLEMVVVLSFVLYVTEKLLIHFSRTEEVSQRLSSVMGSKRISVDENMLKSLTDHFSHL